MGVFTTEATEHGEKSMQRATASASIGFEISELRLVNAISDGQVSRRGSPPSGAERPRRVLPPAGAEASGLPHLQAMRDLHESELLRMLAGSGARARQITAALEKLSRSATDYPERITVRVGLRLKVVPVADVDYFEADSNYVRLHVGDRSHLIRGPLSSLEDKLDPARYLRVRRSLIVALDRVQEIEPYSAGEFVLHLRSGQRLVSGGTYKRRVQRAFGIR